jgi:hypothetical protein
MLEFFGSLATHARLQRMLPGISMAELATIRSLSAGKEKV